MDHYSSKLITTHTAQYLKDNFKKMISQYLDCFLQLAFSPKEMLAKPFF